MRIACLKFGKTKALEEIVIRSRIYSTQQARLLTNAAVLDDIFFLLHTIQFFLLRA